LVFSYLKPPPRMNLLVLPLIDVAILIKAGMALMIIEHAQQLLACPTCFEPSDIALGQIRLRTACACLPQPSFPAPSGAGASPRSHTSRKVLIASPGCRGWR
jgi:hypothetical protein